MMRAACFLLLCLARSADACADGTAEFSKWTPQPADWKGASIAEGQATLTAEKWSYLIAPGQHAHADLSATVTIEEPAKQFQFFGQSWSAWPDKTFGDGGFEAGLLLRGGETSTPFNGQTITESVGYRVQLSHKYQAIALVKFPEGGYMRVAACAVKLKHSHELRARVDGNQIVVHVDGEEKIRWQDTFLPIQSGAFGVGVSSAAKATFNDVSLKGIEPSPPLAAADHTPRFSVRKFLGDRPWVFDGDEPILQLHTEKDPSCFAKLRPGYKPQLTFDSHWGLENQGAFPDAASKWTAPVVSGGGGSMRATWSARNVKDHFTTKSTLQVGFDAERGMYAYDIESELEVLPGEPFHFRYGFDFEHHTPLDPFRWQYLIAKRRDGELYHRPVYPIDPGPQYDLNMTSGARVWYGRHVDKMHVAPAVEYFNSPGEIGDRQCNTAVCAAFYDTGVAFVPETPQPGAKIRVRYRYTGYAAGDAERLFQQSKIYDAPTLDPEHHYIFADEWPKLTFSKFEPLSKTWIYGRTPFRTSHNARPTYSLEKNCGAGSGFAMKLGPASFGKANLPVGSSLTKGRWGVTALVKSVNAHGPGGRMEIEATQAKTNKVLAAAKHFFGAGSFDWRRQGFVFDVPEDASALAVAFGNAGTGEMSITDVEFRKLNDGESPTADVAARPNETAAAFASAPAGAIADYRMEEGRGYHVFNYAGGEHLDLANLDWVVDSGRPALRFADNVTGRKDYCRESSLGRHYLASPAYADKGATPVALSGHHGGGAPVQGLTLAAWVKPAAEMGRSPHGGKGDVVGYGARRFILSLQGQTAPYRLTARINVNDAIGSETKLEADRWYHVAMTAEPSGGQKLVRLFLDGKQVGEGVTKQFPANVAAPRSLVLGCELFYFHDAYFRGSIGRVLVFERALSSAEVAELAK